MHQIANLKCFSSRRAVVFVQSNEARWLVENEDVVGAAPTGDAPTTSEWLTILLSTKVLILETLRYLWCHLMTVSQNHVYDFCMYDFNQTDMNVVS